MTEAKRGNILVVDDEKNIVIVLSAILEKRGFYVEGFTDPKRALEAASLHAFDAVITDLFMPEMDGIALLKEMKKLRENLPVIVITAFGAVETAVDAMRSGAFDYVTKPFEQSEIASVVEKAVNTKRLAQLELIPGGRLAEERAEEPAAPSPLLTGAGPAMRAVAALVARVADSPSPLLIIGERGTGKELLVESIHANSRRAKEPLVRLNCAALAPGAMEAELFGSAARPGRIELARGGTLFLDEISELERSAQIRLAAFLETGAFEHGGTGARARADVRVIAGSNRSLEAEVAAGDFREELWYALNVVPVRLPPLRERQEDFSAIVDYFLKRISRRQGREVPALEREALARLERLRWPGNLRQLENVLERMVLLAEPGAVLTERDIPVELLEEAGEQANERFREVVKRKTQSLERDLIERALRTTGDNVTRAAEQLGLSRKGLQLKMKELGIR